MQKKIFLCLNIIALAVFLILVCSILAAEYIRHDSPALGDFSLPVYYGYAFYQGDDVITSPMGFIYSLINGVAFIFLDKFHLGLNKIVFTASLFFSVGIVAIWALIRRFTQYKIPFIVLMVTIFLACRPNANALLYDLLTTWNAQYNFNQWGLVFLEMVLSALIFSRKDILLKQKDKDVYILSAIYALFLYITFNYKMNYFVGATLVALIPALVFPVKKSIKFFLAIFIFFVLANIITGIVSGFDYFTYLEDLYNSFQARIVHDDRIRRTVKSKIFGVIEFALIMGIIVFNKFISFMRGGGLDSLTRSVNKKSSVFIKFLSNFNFKIAVKYCLFTLILVLSVHIISTQNGGEGARYYLIPLAISFFVFCDASCKKAILFMTCFIYIFYNGVLYARVFVKYDKSDYQEVVYNNINPNHKLKFFHEPKRFEIINENTRRRYNWLNMDVPDGSILFDEVIDFYKKFGLNGDDKLFIEAGEGYNNAPFIVNSKYPQNAKIQNWYDSISPLSKDLPDVYKKELEKYDIFIIQKIKADTGGGQETVVKKYIMQNKDYEKIYQTQNLLFYAKKSWIKDRGIAK
ncbi:MAG: hypothetical protein LBQ37_04445 [Elusimicrobiota bacterium]|jgi:hypothetical protein|nr:hypothetical protein [Elusimicrobiota bacterium]